MKIECEVIKPIWFEGKPVMLEPDKPGPVINLENSDAVYLESLGRVCRIESEAEADKAPAKGKKK